jgi:hypothetical protein
MAKHFVEISEDPMVRAIGVTRTINRYRVTGVIDTDMCTPFTATISIEADSEPDATMLYAWFKEVAAEAVAV